MPDDPNAMAHPDPLDAVCAAAERLANRLPGPLRHLRLTSAALSVELEWAEGSPPAAGATAVERSEVDSETGPHYILATTVGTFYRCPEPGAEPFVRAGDTIRPGQRVAILESMKIMMPIEADCAGEVLTVLPEDGEAVEYGARLLAVSVSPAA